MKRFDLLGNERLKEAARRRELSSAVIFDGAFGTGKKAAAAYAAAALLCRSDESERPCGRCRSCIQAAAGSHPDIIFFNPQGENIKVDDIRELRQKSFMAPSQSDFKVIIINRADLMNQQAQNALLKVLEEPVASVFILLTANASLLLQTVKSRCRVYPMEALKPGVIEEYLRNYYAEKGQKTDEKAVRAASAACDGSIGEAMSLIEKGASKAEGAAERFMEALDRGELAVMEACLAASSLGRAEFADFYEGVTKRLVRAALDRPGRREIYIALYDYIQEQRDKLSDNNASAFALSSQLAAYCGGFYRRKA